MEIAAGHFQRFKNARFQKRLKIHAACDFNHATKQIERDRIAPFRARLGNQRLLCQTFGKCLEIRGRRTCGLTRNGKAADDARRDAIVQIGLKQWPLGDNRIAQTGGVGQQMAHGNLRLGWHRIQAFVRVDHYSHIGKFWQEIGNRLIQLHLPFADKDHRGNAGDRLCHRINTPQCVDIHRRRFTQPLRANGNDIRHSGCTANGGKHTGQLARRDIAFKLRPDGRI